MTWKELKDFCNSLDERQLNEEVVVCNDEEILRDITPQTVEDDIYVNNEDREECGTLSELKEALGDDFDINEYFLCTRMGTPFLDVKVD